MPKGSKPITSKWIFTKKLRPDGSIERFKARLVIRGFTQKKGIDYFDTCSPIIRISTIRTVIAFCAINGYLIHQMDVKTALVNGGEIYIIQPEGFEIPDKEDKVCRLKKSLYHCKQAPKQ